MDERERTRRERERRADEAFFDGLLIGRYVWQERSDAPQSPREPDPWIDSDEEMVEDDAGFADDLDMMDEWD